MVTEVTTVNERFIRLRIYHALGVIFFVSVHALTGVSEISVKKEFYAQLHMVVNSYKLVWMSAVSGKEVLLKSTIGNLRKVLANWMIPTILQNSELALRPKS